MSKELLEKLGEIGDSVKSFEERFENVERQAKEQAEAYELKLENLRSEGNTQEAEEVEQRTRAMDEMDGNSLTLNLDEKDIKKFSLSRAMNGYLVKGDPEKYCPFEYDLSRQIVKHNQKALELRARQGGASDSEFQRAMTTLTDGKSGFLIAEEISNTFYGNFRPQTVRGQLGVTELSPGGIPYRTNKKLTNTTSYRRGETASVAASDVTFGQVNMTPKSIGARTIISQEAVMWASPSVDGILQGDLVETIELGKDYDMIAGIGASNQPIGVMNTTGVVNNNAGGGSGQAPTYEVVGIDLPYLLENANALIDDGSLGYLGVPGHVKMLRKEQIAGSAAGDGAYILVPYSKPTGADFLPYKWAATTAIQGQSLGADAGASPLFFGRWSDVFHASWGGMHVKKSDTASDGTVHALTEGMVHIVVTAWDDCAVIRPASIVYDDTMDHA